MDRRSYSILKDEVGAAAVEFAMVLPFLCLALLGIVDGWSYVTSSLSMRAGVKTAANLVLAGSTDDAATQAVALSSWEKRPDDGQVTLSRIHKCGTTVVDASTLCSGPKLSAVFVQIQASATWTPPFTFGVFSAPSTIGHQELIRVR
ncbi:pilus assembly protein [Mesorhizobium sp. ESP6-5]|uniref:TadE/TadG family type IV pilus assembly protein n=1 Tax=unclassified Mesorhizobium TaxID=325217 RepID=UPI001127B985|nr:MULTISPECIES: TadE/TadG family type IV pilus assembly protein [unclassified Mesorhizobium]MBZ9756784.1 pilus assembly protein [Mesorhizobium sp. ESP6-5]TPJ12902.1 pilus assembly protein [Mesorhizobium sp. B2-7-3]TPK79385.1 pilus assembly protein [Mesorhizobium sp. B2-4-18]